jgi:hypothetical protein
MDGRKIKTVKTIDGNTLINEERDRATGKLQVRVETSVNAEGKLIQRCVCNNVVAIRTFKRK